MLTIEQWAAVQKADAGAEIHACSACGDTDIQWDGWHNANDGDGRADGGEGPTEQTHCPTCEDNECEWSTYDLRHGAAAAEDDDAYGSDVGDALEEDDESDELTLHGAYVDRVTRLNSMWIPRSSPERLDQLLDWQAVA